MELRQISYFKSVAENGSFARAADKLHVAQPALSHQISKLEGRLGTKLFTRHARGVRLTESGRIFLTHARKILACVDDARLAVRDAIAEPNGAITIGMPTTIAQVLAGPLIEQAQRLYPMIEVQLIEALSGEISEWHAAGRFDLTIMYLPPQKALPDFIPFLKEDLYLLGAPQCGLEGDTTIPFSEIKKLPLFHTTRTHACRLLLDEAAGQAGIALNYVAEIDSIQLLREFVIRKNGFSIFPCVGPSAIPDSLAYRRIVDPDLHLQSYIAPGVNKPKSRAQSVLMRLLPALVADMAIKTGDFDNRAAVHAA